MCYAGQYLLVSLCPAATSRTAFCDFVPTEARVEMQLFGLIKRLRGTVFINCRLEKMKCRQYVTCLHRQLAKIILQLLPGSIAKASFFFIYIHIYIKHFIIFNIFYNFSLMFMLFVI